MLPAQQTELQQRVEENKDLRPKRKDGTIFKESPLICINVVESQQQSKDDVISTENSRSLLNESPTFKITPPSNTNIMNGSCLRIASETNSEENGSQSSNQNLLLPFNQLLVPSVGCSRNYDSSTSRSTLDMYSGVEIKPDNQVYPTNIDIDEINNGQHDFKKFETYVSKFGRLIRILEEGDSFGEMALIEDLPRSASVICKNDCQFLTMTKQQYELMFAKRERERQELIMSIFPFMANINLSMQKIKTMMCSFKVILALNSLFNHNSLKSTLKEII